MFQGLLRLIPVAKLRDRNELLSEEGTVTIFSVFLVLIFAMVMGMGIDVTIAQYQQAKLQATADRAALAAADIDQTLTPQEVVQSYFETAGLREYLDEVRLPSGNTSHAREVRVTTSRKVPTAFMHLLDVDVLNVAGVSAARDAYSSVEVSLVLDISGSMRFQAGSVPRIDLLKPAAMHFVERVLGTDKTDKVTISLVPYAGQVNPGPRMFELLGGVRMHGESSCLEITSDDFSGLEVPSGSTEQVPHFMNWTIAWDFMDWGWCPQDDTSILPLSNDPAALKEAIEGMRLHDGTGTAYAVKWGLALLDPSSRDIITKLRDEGIASPVSDGRPAEYDADVRKILVLMTDGKITEQQRPRFNSGVLWIDQDGSSKQVKPVVSFVEGASVTPSNGFTALANIHKALADYSGPQGARDIVLPSPLGTLQTHSDNHLGTIKKLRDKFEELETNYDEVVWDYDLILSPKDGKEALEVKKNGERVPLGDVMETLQFGYVDHFDLNGDSDGDGGPDAGVELNNQRNHRNESAKADFRKDLSSVGMNISRFKKLCAAAKDSEIEIFTIAFEAPEAAQQQMKNCASGTSNEEKSAYYFQVNESDGGTLDAAFNEIAASIAKLRLTQ